MRQIIIPIRRSHKALLLTVLLVLGGEMAIPSPASPAEAIPATEAHQSPAMNRPDTAAPAVVPVAALKQQHAGYPTTREKWRYCPRDGSHPCVDLDIPGVTEPDKPGGQ